MRIYLIRKGVVSTFPSEPMTESITYKPNTDGLGRSLGICRAPLFMLGIAMVDSVRLIFPLSSPELHDGVGINYGEFEIQVRLKDQGVPDRVFYAKFPGPSAPSIDELGQFRADVISSTELNIQNFLLCYPPLMESLSEHV